MRVEAGVLARQAAEWFGARPALTSPSGRVSFEELNRAANRIGSGLLALGAARGDRVGVLAYNAAEVMELWLGCEKHNLVRAVLHTHFPMADHVFALNQMEAAVVVFDTRFSDQVDASRSALSTVRHFVAIGPDVPDWAVPYAEVAASGDAAEPGLDVDEDDPCFLQLTSGTTGRPKAWVKTYRSWQAVIDHNLHHLDTFGPRTPPVGADDVNLHFHPLQWATGFQTMYPYLVRGARSVLVDDETFDPCALVDTLLAERVTGTFAPGPLLNPLLDEVEKRGGIDHALRRLVIFFGTADLLERTSALLGPVWAHAFGSTEQGAATTRLLPHELIGRPHRINSVGRSGSPFLEVAIKDPDGRSLGPGEVGEIAVRSAMSIGEYWGMPDKTAEASFGDDWFRPQDVGYLDVDGFLYYSDRAGDTIHTEHGAVYPHLVEAPLLAHRAVANCGVVGLGEAGAQEIVAAVVLKDGATVAEDELASTTASLADHERPARIVFLAELPTVLGGAKVQRAALRAQLEKS